MKNNSSCDISVTLNQSFADKILDGVIFPWKMDYRIKLPGCNSDAIAEAEFSETLDANITTDNHLTEPQADYFEAINGATSINVESSMASEESARLVQKKHRFKINIHNIELEIPQKPIMSFGNPIVLQDIELKIKARFSACVTIYGKTYSTEQTSPWITLAGRSASMALHADATKIKGTLSLNKIDLKLKVKILQWEYQCLIDLTHLLNQQINQHGPFEVLDLSAFQTTIIPNSQPLMITGIDLNPSAEQVTCNLRVLSSIE